MLIILLKYKCRITNISWLFFISSHGTEIYITLLWSHPILEAFYLHILLLKNDKVCWRFRRVMKALWLAEATLGGQWKRRQRDQQQSSVTSLYTLPQLCVLWFRAVPGQSLPLFSLMINTFSEVSCLWAKLNIRMFHKVFILFSLWLAAESMHE